MEAKQNRISFHVLSGTIMIEALTSDRLLVATPPGETIVLDDIEHKFSGIAAKSEAWTIKIESYDAFRARSLRRASETARIVIESTLYDLLNDEANAGDLARICAYGQLAETDYQVWLAEKRVAEAHNSYEAAQEVLAIATRNRKLAEAEVAALVAARNGG